MISESDRGWRRTKSFSMIIPDFGQYMWTATEHKLVYDSLSDEEKKRKEQLESQKRQKEYEQKRKEKQDALKEKYGAESYRKGGGASKEMKKAILDFEKWWNRNHIPSNPSEKFYVRKPFEEGDRYNGWSWCYYLDEEDERLDLECERIPYGNIDALNAWIRQTILMEKPSNFKDWHPIFDER